MCLKLKNGLFKGRKHWPLAEGVDKKLPAEPTGLKKHVEEKCREDDNQTDAATEWDTIAEDSDIGTNTTIRCRQRCRMSQKYLYRCEWGAEKMCCKVVRWF